jgi:hypothetical protein
VFVGIRHDRQDLFLLLNQRALQGGREKPEEIKSITARVYITEHHRRVSNSGGRSAELWELTS